MKAFYFVVLPLFLSVFLCEKTYCQKKENTSCINRYDSTGKKTGFWVEIDKEGTRTEQYYHNGILNGHTIGVGYFYHELGYLIFTVQYLGFEMYKKEKYQKGKFTMYNCSGKIEEEGMALFKEGYEEFGEEIKIGKWKKYK